MVEKLEEYMGEKGKRMINIVEGFYGSVLVYRNKRIDFNCLYYECKINMVIFYKVIIISLICNFIIISKC